MKKTALILHILAAGALMFNVVIGAVTPAIGQKYVAAMLCYTVKEWESEQF